MVFRIVQLCFKQFSILQVAAKSIFEASDRVGLNQTTNSQLDPTKSPMATGACTTPENAAKRFEDDDTWRAKFLLKVQVKRIIFFSDKTWDGFHKSWAESVERTQNLRENAKS